MLEDPIVQLAGVIVLAFLVTWLGERIRVPVILPLLVTGFVLGPILGVIKPDELLGDLLSPLVSIAVGLILFEGGLSLRLREMEGQQRVLWLLVTVGVLVTWVIATLVTLAFTDLSRGMAVLVGSVLIVSGPTVIGPLLTMVRPRRSVASILKWESILIDPIGALLAVVTFEILLLGGTDSMPGGTVLSEMGAFAAAGIISGTVVALGAAEALRRHWVSEHLLPLFGLSIALIAFTISDGFAAESGLLATTVLGFTLANHRRIRTEQIVHFSEVIRVLLIGVLFIVLSARLSTAQLKVDLPGAIALVVALVLVARPLGVAIATWRSRLGWRERVLLGAVAPRGIVAASVASVFALELQHQGIAGADEVVPLTFAVIVATVVIYGLGMGPLARRLGLAARHQEGVLIIGAGPVERAVADALADSGVAVVLATTNRQDHYEARMAGRRAYYGNVLARDVDLDLDLAGIGRLLALTPNDEVNTLACSRFAATFGGAETYQLAPRQTSAGIDSNPATDFGGRILFGTEWDYATLAHFLDAGGTVGRSKTGPDLAAADSGMPTGDMAAVLFVVRAGGRVRVITSDHRQPLRDIGPGDTVVALMEGTAEPG
jgi:NhaP-type Na+/H+ or K+/H+ antiporter